MSKEAEAYSDIKMVVATQVAYLDGEEGMTVKELVDQTLRNLDGRNDLTAKQEAQCNTARYIRELIQKNDDLKACDRWVVEQVLDTNSKNGFYGCLIDTRDGDAIISFRGSESYDDTQKHYDWLEADFGLLNNSETTQQKQAREFTRYINEKYGDRFDNYHFSGHSLGGNLAEHAALTASEDMNVGRCLNLDGPGFSGEYIAAHKWDIKRWASHVDHYQYSVVGTLLFPVEGSNYRTIEAKNDESKSGLESYFWRHHTRNIEFDSNGMAQDGKQDLLSQFAGPLSKDIEDGAPGILYGLCPGLAVLWTIADKGYTLLLEMREDAKQLVKTVGESLSAIKESVANWFRAIFGVELTGEYEMNVSGVFSLSASYQDTAKNLHKISQEINDIAVNLRYNSLSGSWYRSKLRSISNKVKKSGTQVDSLGEAARSCASCISNGDNKSAAVFAAV